MFIRGVAKDVDVARISIIGLNDTPGIAFKIFNQLASKKINIDIILQSVGRDGTKDITFTVATDKCDEAVKALNDMKGNVSFTEVLSDKSVAKVSIVGAGMEAHPGVAAKMFEALFDKNINIQMIATSETKISVLIDEKDAVNAMVAVHEELLG
jgi:aspartate kinase